MSFFFFILIWKIDWLQIVFWKTIFRVKVVIKKDDFLLSFSFIIFHMFFQNFKKNYMKVVFIKDNFHVFCQISTKYYRKVFFCKDDCHIIFFFFKNMWKLSFVSKTFVKSYFFKRRLSTKSMWQNTITSTYYKCKSNQNSFLRQTTFIGKIVFPKEDFQLAYFSNYRGMFGLKL